MTDTEQRNNRRISRFSDALVSSFDDERLVNLTVTSFPKGDVIKAKGSVKTVSSLRVLQIEYALTEGRVRHKNVGRDELPGIVRSMIEEGACKFQINASDGTASLFVSSKGVVNTSYKLGKPLPLVMPAVVGNDNEKNYIFNGDESFLIKLGISDKNGRVHDKMRSKFRQINRFTEQVRDIVKYLPKKGALSVYDLCCGKSYLSFALYSYLTDVLGRDVSMLCVDRKQSVMDYCSSVASELGFSGMKFICDDITTMDATDSPDLVVSLHACDTATDIVLDFAVRSRARVILSTPCCQHEMYRIMNCPDLDFISSYSLLKQKIASAATDALRLMKLEAEGYKTDAIELIDPEETPKNLLIRGILKKNYDKDSPAAKLAAEKYKRSYYYMTGVEL
ncbi:MAG: SAM-dependent methyltransferase [Clostridia bacterium]|nr:SAM-dependent methyltransferase [Clostridia bacterium]